MPSSFPFRLILLSASFALTAAAAGAAGNDSTAGVTVQHPATVNIQQPASVNVVNPATAAAAGVVTSSPAAVMAVNVTTPAVTPNAAMTVQQRDEFVDAANATIANARQVAQKINTGLTDGTLHGYSRRELNTLNDRIAEAEASDIRLQRSSVDSLAKDFKSARRSLNSLEDAYYPAAARFEDARKLEEQRVQADIARLNQHKANLQATVGASKLSHRLKDDANDTERQLEAAVASSQKRLGQLQNSKDHRWANLRHETQEKIDRGDQSYHQTIERLTRPS